MKELSIEQKAKRYDEAIAKAKNIVNSINVGLIGKDSFEAVFPELVESEDERIRKFIATAIENLKIIDNEDRNSLCNKALAWLEKQGEHDNFRNKIQIGDKVTRNEDGVLVNLSQLKRVAKKDEKQGKQKPADKVEPKFKVGDEIKTANEESLIITKIDEKGYWSEDLFICGFNEECIWDLVEQKPVEWRPIDNEYMTKLCEIIDGYDAERQWKGAIKDWLKSLRPQSTWKPSDEQMKLLREVQQELLGKDCHNRFVNFMYELKRLME